MGGAFQPREDRTAVTRPVATNHGADVIYSLDKLFLKAGKLLGLPVSMGIRTR
jgi:hypothetical protein